MSTNENGEEQRQEKLANLQRALLINVGTTAFGILLFFVMISLSVFFNLFVKHGFIAAIGCFLLPFAIIAAPMIRTFLRVESISKMFNTDVYYTVITTYSNGRTSSDGGAQAAAENFWRRVFIIIILYLLSLIVQPIREIVLIIQYAILSRKVSEKPPFSRSALFFVALLVASFVVGITFAVIIDRIQTAEIVAKNKIRDARYQAGMAIIATGDNLYEKADHNSAVIKKLNEYDKLTVTGGVVYEPRSVINAFIPVEHNGVKGWAWERFTNIITGTATITTDDVIVIGGGGEDYKVLSSKPLPIGSKVEIVSISRDKETNKQTAGVWYNGRYIFIEGEGIRLDE